jgi:hypothetical protein
MTLKTTTIAMAPTPTPATQTHEIVRTKAVACLEKR